MTPAFEITIKPTNNGLFFEIHFVIRTSNSTAIVGDYGNFATTQDAEAFVKQLLDNTKLTLSSGNTTPKEAK